MDRRIYGTTFFLRLSSGSTFTDIFYFKMATKNILLESVLSYEQPRQKLFPLF